MSMNQHSDKKCVKCYEPASFSIKNPATTLYYCSEHYFKEPSVQQGAMNDQTDELRRTLLKLKDQSDNYVISSLIAAEPFKLHALLEFITAQTTAARIAELKTLRDTFVTPDKGGVESFTNYRIGELQSTLNKQNKVTLSDIASPDPSPAAQAAIQTAVDESIKAQNIKEKEDV